MKNDLKNFGFKRKSGILMPISSLPSEYGIGSFGKSARGFVDFLADCGVKCWQVLPLNPTAFGDSPYQSPASMAGNPYFIDLDILCENGLLKSSELKEHKDNCKRVNYGKLFETRYTVLRKAYSVFAKRGEKNTSEYKKFLNRSCRWISDYTLFMALKCKYGYAAWTTWADEHKDVKKARLCAEALREERSFWEWVQFEFFRQWKALSDYAHSKSIVIIGDMPIYVAHDSLDVWQNPDKFLLDSDFNPKRVAGCPPDGFSPDGQLWGNPIYDWELMRRDGFAWWKRRVAAAFELYDILRIDHFRGFAGYYSIPYGEATAKSGAWSSAPGKELFKEIKRTLPKAKIIAEDLGFITDDVRELLKTTGFPGMKILQFAFDNEDSEYLPRCFETNNCVVYTGSHDSECTRSFCSALKGKRKARFMRECPVKEGETPTDALISLVLNSCANLAIIPIQDYLGLTSAKGRINTPSIAEGNWTFRLSKNYKKDSLKEKIRTMLQNSDRAV